MRFTQQRAQGPGSSASLVPPPGHHDDAPSTAATQGRGIFRGRAKHAAPSALAAPTSILPMGQQHEAPAEPQLQRPPVSSRSARRKQVLARQTAQELLALAGPEDMQDFLACMILAECVYKKVELTQEGLVSTISSMLSAFPPGWVTLEAVQMSRNDLPQHYLLATGGDALYVAFMGTKQPRDLVTDATFLHEAVWAESVALASDKQSVPAAHSGFLQRARAINVEQLHDLATASGRRLVLCGHSLGGAVAKLSTLRLLRELPEWPAPKLKCVCFATPAVGNAALADLVKNAGWGSHFKTYFMPEDQVMRLMSFSQSKAASGAAAAAAAARGGTAVPAGATSAAGLRPAWSWAGSSAASTAPMESTQSSGLSIPLLSSMDATEAAMEDILSSPPTLRHVASAPGALDAAALACSCAHHDTECMQTAAQEAAGPSGSDHAPTPTPPFNLGLAFALQQKRVARAVQKLAGQARIPLPLPKAYFHTFGAQLFIHSDRTYPSDQQPAKSGAAAADGRAAAFASADAADVDSAATSTAGSLLPSDYSHNVKGPFNYHRMVAHRLRVLNIIAKALPEELRAQHHARVAAAAAAAAVPVSPAPATAGAEPGSFPTAATGTSTRTGRRGGLRVKADDLFPRISAGQAVARLPVTLDLDLDAASGAPLPASTSGTPQTSAAPGSASAGPADAGQPAGGSPAGRGKLPGLWGRRQVEEQVSLLMEVEGHNLQYCHHVVAHMTPSSSSASMPSPSSTSSSAAPTPASIQLPTEVVRVITDPELAVHHPLSLLQSRLNQVTGSIGRYIGRVKAPAGAEPLSKMIVRVSLPKSVARQFMAQAQASCTPSSPLAAPGSSSPQPPPTLSLHLKSHFHEASAQVHVLPYKAAVLGTSVHAATLVQAALSARPSVVAAAAPAMAAAAAATPAAAPAAAGSTRTAVSYWWRPEPMRWARRFWAPVGMHGTAAAAANDPTVGPPPPSTAGAEPTSSVPGSLALAAKDMLPSSSGRARAASDPGTALLPVPTPFSLLPRGRAAWPSSPPFDGGSASKRRHEDDSHPTISQLSAEYYYSHSAPTSSTVTSDSDDDAPRQQAEQVVQQEAARHYKQYTRIVPVLQPVAGLFLVVRFIRQATARIVAARLMSSTAAAAGGHAALPAMFTVSGGGGGAAMPAGAALLMRRRAASYAASVVLQQLGSQGGSQAGALPLDTQGRLPAISWFPGMRFLAGFGRMPYLQLVGSVLRPRGVGGSSGAQSMLALQTAPLLSRSARGDSQGVEAMSAMSSGGDGGGLTVPAGGAAGGRRRQGAWWGGSGTWGLRTRPTRAVGEAPTAGSDGEAEAPLLLHASPLAESTDQLPPASSSSAAWAALASPVVQEFDAAAAVTSDSGAVAHGWSLPLNGRTSLDLAVPRNPQQHQRQRHLSVAVEHAAGDDDACIAIFPAAAPKPASPGRPAGRATIVRAASSAEPLQQMAALRGSSPEPSPRMLRSISYHNSFPGGSGGAAVAGKPMTVRQAHRKAQQQSAQQQPATAAGWLPRLRGGTAAVAPRVPPALGARQAARLRAKAAAQLGVPPETAVLGGSVVVHNVLATAPVASPFVVLRALTASLRRQAARLRRPWSSGGLGLRWQQAQQGQQPRRGAGPLQPAGALLHVYNFIRGIPFWIQQKRSHGALTLDQDWKVLLVAASALDPTRLLQGRDFARMALRAKAAGVALLPVLLTAPAVPEAARDRAAAALAAACGVDVAAVQVVMVDDALLQPQPQQPMPLAAAAAIGDDGSGAAIATAVSSTEIALARARELVGRAPGVSGLRAELQALLQQDWDSLLSQPVSSCPLVARSIAPRSRL